MRLSDSAASTSTDDYNDLDTTISFADGELVRMFLLVLKNDNVAEFSEFFKINVIDPTNATLGTIVQRVLKLKTLILILQAH